MPHRQSLAGLREHLQAAESRSQEAVLRLRDYLSRLEANPGAAGGSETRLAALDRLKRKYGAF